MNLRSRRTITTSPKRVIKKPKKTVKAAANGRHAVLARAMVPPPPTPKVDFNVLRRKLATKLHMDAHVIDTILTTIMTTMPRVKFDDIIGQEEAVKAVRERVVYPALNPELFKGQKVLKPPRGVLLYGPTGNGKTLLAKACAAQSHYNFMNVSASSLISKWVGDSEKLVKLLFECAKEIQPTIVFIDEIDAMLSQRVGAEREDTRRFKNEFLVHFDGIMCCQDDRVLILGATNIPQCIDSAALRRFDLRVFMGPPSSKARELILRTILKDIRNNFTEPDIRKVAGLTEGYSASDLGIIARNAAWLPLGTIKQSLIPLLQKEEVPEVTVHHFLQIVEKFVPSNSADDVQALKDWVHQHKSCT
ncbi:spastin-like [Paramacrobiotus metropolitanus]|uniref:spastin-like n=1 Tax=Paramacrobiotus metropolitanus TaxID=2943436 RepID=UPI0024460130|nr:spastin-like [Paramacrobiotus metropolitanus]